jgi:hypothetical protein
LIAGIDPSALGSPSYNQGLERGISLSPHTRTHTPQARINELLMSILAVSATPTTNLRVILSSAPPGSHVVRCDFDPFLDRERRDVTDPMPAPCISSCCNAANRSAQSAARRLFGPGPWRWYRDCLNLGRISSCPPPTRSYSLGRECFKAGRVPHKKIRYGSSVQLLSIRSLGHVFEGHLG